MTPNESMAWIEEKYKTLVCRQLAGEISPSSPYMVCEGLARMAGGKHSMCWRLFMPEVYRNA